MNQTDTLCDLGKLYCEPKASQHMESNTPAFNKAFVEDLLVFPWVVYGQSDARLISFAVLGNICCESKESANMNSGLSSSRSKQCHRKGKSGRESKAATCLSLSPRYILSRVGDASSAQVTSAGKYSVMWKPEYQPQLWRLDVVA